MCVCERERKREHICVFSLRIMSFAVLSLLQSSRPYVRLSSESLNLQLNGFVHLAIGFLFCFVLGFFTSREGWEDTTSAKKHLTSRFLSYNPPRKTHTHSLLAQTQSHTEIKACQKETDLQRLTQVQMSQCGWISCGIVSVPSFDKEVFLVPRRDATVSSGLGSPRQQQWVLSERTQVNPLSCYTHTHTQSERKWKIF